MIDLDAYLHRIAYTGPRTPTLDTLQAVLALHPQAIPFENLNPLLGWPVRLDAASLEAKLVHGGRGGYCYEQNLLLSHALTALGFRVTWLAARVRWNVPDETVTPRSHMVLRVDLDGQPYLADAGFGGMTLTGPLRLVPGLAQATPLERFRLMETDGTYQLEGEVRDVWQPLYRFDLQVQHLPDYEVASWYVSTHPASHFVTGLIAARTGPEHRYTLRGNEFAVHPLHGGTERRVLEDVPAIRAVLEDTMCLTLPDTPDLDVKLEQVLAVPA